MNAPEKLFPGTTPKRWLGLAALVAASTCVLGPIRSAEPSVRPPAQLQIDDTPPVRSTTLTTSFASVVKRVTPSVVSIFTTKKVANFRLHDSFPFFADPNLRRWFGDVPGNDPGSRPQFRKERGLGSGVIVTRDGYILSNNHVVDGADEIKVALADEKRQFVARIVGRDPQTDIALLKIDATGLSALTLTDSDKVEVGDVVLAIGNPFGVGQSVSHGIISAVGRGGLGIETYEDFIQTDAAVNPGNSGGALVDAQGRLVGINTAIATRTGASAGVSFAVPANMARSVLEKVLKDGRLVRGFLGVGIQNLTPELAKEFDAPSVSGALVGQVEPKGAAAEAGLRSGDIIIEFNGKPVPDSRQLRLAVAHTDPGTKVELKVLRQGKPKTFSVTLKEMPEKALARGDVAPEAGSGDDVLKEVTVSDLDSETRRQFNVPPDLRGALVTAVTPDSPAYEAGLRAGDIILEINRKAIRDAEDAVVATRNVRNKRVLLHVWNDGTTRFLVVDESQGR